MILYSANAPNGMSPQGVQVILRGDGVQATLSVDLTDFPFILMEAKQIAQAVDITWSAGTASAIIARGVMQITFSVPVPVVQSVLSFGLFFVG